MVSISHMLEDGFTDDTKENIMPEDKLIKSNKRKNLAIAGLLGIPVGMSLSQLIHQAKSAKE